MLNDLFSPLGLSLDGLEEAFQRAQAGTVSHGDTAVPTADRSTSPEPSGEIDPDGEQLLDGAELLRAARDPVEWLLTLAHRLAANEPEEIAAIDRLRAAFHARLAGRDIGVRKTDVLIAFALLVGALDRNIVIEGVSRTIADGVATLLTHEGITLAAQLARVANGLPRIVVHHAHSAHPRRRRNPSSTSL